MRFLNSVLAAMNDQTEKALQDAKTEVVKRLFKGDSSSVSFKRAVATWRKAWKQCYGFSLTPDQEKRFLDVLSEREPDALPQLEKKKA